MRKLDLLKELALGNRSYRRFDGKCRIPAAVLRNLIGLARLAPTGANQQPLRFRLIHRARDCAGVFPHLAWAGYLKDWPGPSEAERPTAYIVIMNDARIRESAGTDAGIAAQTIMLGAVAAGFGGCMIGSVARDALQKQLQLPEYLRIILVLALGKPAEKVVLTQVRANDIRYYRDARGVHRVPKRALRDLIV